MTQLPFDEDPEITPKAGAYTAETKPPTLLVSAPGALDVFTPTGEKPPTEAEILETALEEVAMEIEASMDDALLKSRKAAYPREKYAWASELHHPCLKQLVHARRDWKEKKPMEADALWRIGTGSDYEDKIRMSLTRAGYELLENQGYLRNEEFFISGKMDGMVAIKKKMPPPFDKTRTIPLEVKTINPMFWDSVKTLEAIKNHRGWWIRKYPSQLNFYMHEKKAPAGLILLGTFGRRPRIIPMVFDEDLWREDTAQIAKANAHLEKGTTPDPIPFDSSICGMCDFAHICNPLRTTTMTTGITPDDEIALNFYLDLKVDFDRINSQFEAEKRRLIGDKKKPGKFYGHTAFIGDIEIATRDVERKAYEVKAGSYKVTSIERIRPD